MTTALVFAVAAAIFDPTASGEFLSGSWTGDTGVGRFERAASSAATSGSLLGHRPAERAQTDEASSAPEPLAPSRPPPGFQPPPSFQPDPAPQPPPADVPAPDPAVLAAAAPPSTDEPAGVGRADLRETAAIAAEQARQAQLSVVPPPFGVGRQGRGTSAQSSALAPAEPEPTDEAAQPDPDDSGSDNGARFGLGGANGVAQR